MSKAESLSICSDQRELRAHIAREVGSDPERYLDPDGRTHQLRLLSHEITEVADRIVPDAEDYSRKQDRMDAIMTELDREHRLGTDTYDGRDLLAIIDALEEDRDE